MRRATDDTAVARLVLEVFLSTLSLRRATWTTSAAARPPANFYPRSPCGERPSDGAHPFLPGNFYPRSPCGERRPPPIKRCCIFRFLSTLSLRRATCLRRSAGSSHRISIHTLLRPAPGHRHFYPRSPCGERPDAHPTLTGKDAKFLSTLSLRRATAPAKAATNDGGDFYPRSPCGERPILGNPCAGCPAISIHALLAESDAVFAVLRNDLALISIHALLAESDRRRHATARRAGQFLSTLSLRRATHKWGYPIYYDVISIHALLAESDAAIAAPAAAPSAISIHALLAESDKMAYTQINLNPISILLAESDVNQSNAALT